NIDNFKASALITTSDIANIDTGEIDVINETGIAFANFNQWLFQVSRESFGLISEAQLHRYDNELNEIFETISYEKEGQCFFNESYHLHINQSKIRLAFSIKRDLQTDTEVIPKQAELLIAERLTEVEKNARLYPNEADTTKILELDKSNATVSIDTAEIEKAYQLTKETMEAH